MKSLLLIAALLSSTAGAGPQMPSELRGKWCDANKSGSYQQGPCERTLLGGNFETEITATAWDALESHCVPIQITKYNVYPWGRRAPANPWGPGYHFKFRCIGEEGKFVIIERDWQREKDILLMRKHGRHVYRGSDQP